MSFNGQLLASGGVAQCLTDSVQLFGADGTYSSNIAVYEFNGDATDTTGTYNATTQGSPTYVTGKFGQAASLSNSDTDYFTTSISPTILGNSFSLSAWVYFTQNSGTSDYYSIAGAYWDYNSSTQQSWIFYVTNGTLKFFSNLGATSGSGSITLGTNTVPLNTWTFVGFSVSDKDEISVYLNDQVETSSVTQSLRPNNVTLTLGNLGTYTEGNRTMYGILDQVRVFDRQLSQAEFYTLYNETDSTTSNTNLLNDGAGASLYGFNYDASDAGQLYNAVSSNVDFGVGGQINTAVRFNGSNSQITIADAGIGNNTTARLTFSVSIWVKTTSTSAAAIVSDYDGADYAFYLQMNANGTLYMGNYFDGSGSFTSGTATINDGNWHNLVLINNTSDNTQKLFVDANNTPDINQTLTSGTKNEVDVQVGYYASAGGYVFDGDIDQLRFFTIALSTNQMDTIYAEQACVYTCTTDTVNYPDTTNLAYYKLDNSADDETGVYDGTPENINYSFGRYGQAADFNGSSSVITLTATGSSSAFALSTYTASLWIYADDYNQSNTTYLNMGLAQSGLTWYGIAWTLNAGKIRIYGGDATGVGGYGFFTQDSTITLPNTLWVHLVFILNGTSITAYINGEQDTSLSRTLGANIGYVTNSNFELGRRRIATLNYGWYDGKIDQFRFFNSAITSSQVTELYNEKPCADTSTFAATLYDGNGGHQYVSNVGFKPDFVWIKSINQNVRHLLTDVVRGTTSQIFSNEQLAAQNYLEFTSFDANGFTVDFNSGTQYFNNSGTDYVAWCWKAGGDAVLNEVGDIDSQVSANTNAGFSIVKYTGNGIAGTTVGHGLNVNGVATKPEFILFKNLDTAVSWIAYDTINNLIGYLDNTDTLTDGRRAWAVNNTDPTSTVVTLGNNQATNDTSNFIMYCWHSVAGYSKIGTYTGATSGVTENIGFEPSMVIIKNETQSDAWGIFDNKRPSGTDFRSYLYPNTADDEDVYSSSLSGLSLTATGFTINNTNSNMINENGETFLYMAFK
tara:strand:+ start:15195 stop:18257 length:3063 start_codon:yes stop_codon:yes gene_type:complete